MRFQPEVTVNALHELERLLASPNCRPASLAFARTMSAIDHVLVILERQVVHEDGFGSPVTSELEVVFRAAHRVIASQLVQLESALRWVSALDPLPSGLPGWSRFLEVIPVAKLELERITEDWLAERRVRLRTRVPSTDPDLDLAAPRRACAELGAMEQIPAIERMLYRGVAAQDQPAIATACEQMLVAMRIRADLPSVRRQWLAVARWRSVAYGAER